MSERWTESIPTRIPQAPSRSNLPTQGENGNLAVAAARPVVSGMGPEARDAADEPARVAKTKQNGGRNIELVALGSVAPALKADLPLAIEDYALIDDYAAGCRSTKSLPLDLQKEAKDAVVLLRA